MKRGYWFLLSFILVIVDQLSKYWATSFLIPYKPVSICPNLNFTLAYNSGAAFSFLSETGEWHRWFFAGFSTVISIILIFFLWRIAHKACLQTAAVCFILGGAVGNLIDRVGQGYVVDFIDFYYKHHHFATFNLADSAICIGTFVLFLDLLINRE